MKITGALDLSHLNFSLSFMRHGQALSNLEGLSDKVDAPLTEEGKLQASNVGGHYDLVILSPLRRCMETLLYSKITYENVLVSYDVREFAINPCDLLPGESGQDRPEDLQTRIAGLEKTLSTVGDHLRVLIISHAYFFNAWFMQDCCPAPEHATILRLN